MVRDVVILTSFGFCVSYALIRDLVAAIIIAGILFVGIVLANLLHIMIEERRDRADRK